jgi:mannitol-1-/sugar-/sorbitol-6-/2-deoxyglucose-6-phosphatase
VLVMNGQRLFVKAGARYKVHVALAEKARYDARVRAVIFDVDGVLIDSEPLWQESEIEVFGDVGITLDQRLCLNTIGLRSDELVAYWYERFPWTGQAPVDVERALLNVVTNHIRRRAEAKIGVDAALAFLAGCDVRLGLASSSPYTVIAAVLEKLGLIEVFDCVHSAEEEPYGKPHPGVYLSAARKLDVPPEACVAVEDSVNGVVAAKAAKMTCIAVPDPRLTDDPRFVLADAVLQSLVEFNASLWNRLTGYRPRHDMGS